MSGRKTDLVKIDDLTGIDVLKSSWVEVNAYPFTTGHLQEEERHW
jgi:hypothetical protein